MLASSVRSAPPKAVMATTFTVQALDRLHAGTYLVGMSVTRELQRRLSVSRSVPAHFAGDGIITGQPYLMPITIIHGVVSLGGFRPEPALTASRRARF